MHSVVALDYISVWKINVEMFSDGACSFQENAEKQISVEEDTPPGNDKTS